MNKKIKIISISVLILTILSTVFAVFYQNYNTTIGPAAQEANAAAPTEVPEEVEPTATLEPSALLLNLVRDVLADGNRDVQRIQQVQLTDCFSGSCSLMITFAINDNETQELINNQVKSDITNILRTLEENFPLDISKVLIQGTFSIVDEYGNRIENIVVDLVYVQETLDQIDWETFNFKDVYMITDGFVNIHPDFLP